MNIIIQTREVATGVATIGSRNAVRAQRAPRKSRFRTTAITKPSTVEATTDIAVSTKVRANASQNRALVNAAA